MKYLPFTVSICIMSYALYFLLLDSAEQPQLVSVSNESTVRPDSNVADAIRPSIVRRREEDGRTVITSDNDINPRFEMRLLYKWRDKANSIVISSDPPDRGIDYEVFRFTSRSPMNESGFQNASRGNTAVNPFAPSFQSNPLRVYTPDGIRELIRYSQAIGEKIQIRDAELNELIEQL